MHSKVEVGSPTTAGAVAIIPVVRISLGSGHGSHGLSFWGTKQPIAVLAISPSARKAFRLTGEEVPLDQLIQEVPDIKDILERG